MQSVSAFVLAVVLHSCLMNTMTLARKVHCTARKLQHASCFQLYSTSPLSTDAVADSKAKSSMMYRNFEFRILPLSGNRETSSCKARLTEIVTPHGKIETPNFVFCATKAAMKAITPDQLRAEGTQIMLSNTYHLMLTPGSEIIQSMGGLQKFTAWNGPMLTDSGGFQIFSMGFGSVSNEVKGRRAKTEGVVETLLEINEAGARFRSYVDGSIQELSPERSIEVQRQLGADLVVVLDECTPFNVDKAYTEASMHRSHRWAVRSLEQFKRTDSGAQALYGIIQGGVYRDLREVSTDFINAQSFFGTAIGGSLGATKQEMHEIVSLTRSRVRDDRPVHLLGIGGIRDIFHGVRQGIDTFDCVHPSRVARHGGALVMSAHWEEDDWPEPSVNSKSLAADRRAEKLRLKEAMRAKHMAKLQMTGPGGKAEASNGSSSSNSPTLQHSQPVSSNSGGNGTAGYWSNRSTLRVRTIREHISLFKASMRHDPRPVDSTCGCYTCQRFSRAYLHHLFKTKETLAGTLVRTFTRRYST